MQQPVADSCVTAKGLHVEQCCHIVRAKLLHSSVHSCIWLLQREASNAANLSETL
jgi:hypothetical protein